MRQTDRTLRVAIARVRYISMLTSEQTRTGLILITTLFAAGLGSACGGNSSPSPTPPPGNPQPQPTAWRSAIGKGGVFTQTFDDQVWSSRDLTQADLYAVACSGNWLGWVAGAGGLIAHTTDGGRTWSWQTSHLTSNLYAVRFEDAARGLIAGAGGALALSQNGGTDWSKVTVPTTADLHAAATAADRGIFIVVGDGGTVVRSTDQGATWLASAVPNAGDFRGVASDSSAQVIIAVDTHGDIWTSDDAGETFTREFQAGTPLYAVAMGEGGGAGGNALVVGAHGVALERDTSGLWHTVDVGTSVDLYAALITDEGKHFYTAGAEGTLMTSTDEGARWTRVRSGTEASLYALDDL